MPIDLRCALNWQFYMIASSDATWYDVSAHDWCGMYCAFGV